MEGETPFMPLHRVAVRLGLPMAWLRAEVEAGRVPHIKAGRRVLLNPETVERLLHERAAAAGKGELAHA